MRNDGCYDVFFKNESFLTDLSNGFCTCISGSLGQNCIHHRVLSCELKVFSFHAEPFLTPDGRKLLKKIAGYENVNTESIHSSHNETSEQQTLIQPPDLDLEPENQMNCSANVDEMEIENEIEAEANNNQAETINNFLEQVRKDHEIDPKIDEPLAEIANFYLNAQTNNQKTEILNKMLLGIKVSKSTYAKRIRIQSTSINRRKKSFV